MFYHIPATLKLIKNTLLYITLIFSSLLGVWKCGIQTWYLMSDNAIKETNNLTIVTEFLHSYCSTSVQYKYQWRFSFVSRGSLSSNRVYLFHHNNIKQVYKYKKGLFIPKSSTLKKREIVIWHTLLTVKAEANSFILAMHSKELWLVQGNLATVTVLNYRISQQTQNWNPKYSKNIH